LQTGIVNDPDGPHAFDIRDRFSRSQAVVTAALQFLCIHLQAAP
jgi:hypothetical protein